MLNIDTNWFILRFIVAVDIDIFFKIVNGPLIVLPYIRSKELKQNKILVDILNSK